MADSVSQIPWRSETSFPAPKKMMTADDTLKADAAYRLACEGTGIIWSGDFQNAKQLLQALQRRVEKAISYPNKTLAAGELFHLHRKNQAHKARILSMLLIPIEADLSIQLRRAPDASVALSEVYGKNSGPFLCSLREILGFIGAHEWRKKGVPLASLGFTIHPHYGVFSPARGEYLDLIQNAQLPATDLALDIGTGTGVIAALLAKRGVQKIIATEQNPRAIACAEENILKLGLQSQIEIQNADLFPNKKAPLIVCNPPWIPAKPTSIIEYAIYDFESKMLKGFLLGLSDHLLPNGEGWLILSDIAEHLGLRTREELLDLFAKGNLKVIERIDTKPKHAKTKDTTDPLYEARKKEITSLWRLARD